MWIIVKLKLGNKLKSHICTSFCKKIKLSLQERALHLAQIKDVCISEKDCQLMQNIYPIFLIHRGNKTSEDFFSRDAEPQVSYEECTHTHTHTHTLKEILKRLNYEDEDINLKRK